MDKFDKAWQVFMTLKQRGTVFDSFTFSALIKGVNFSNQSQYLHQIIDFVQDMIKDSNFTPDEILFNVLIDTCIKCKKLDKALELFEFVKKQDSKVKPDEITFNTLIKGYSLN